MVLLELKLLFTNIAKDHVFTEKNTIILEPIEK